MPSLYTEPTELGKALVSIILGSLSEVHEPKLDSSGASPMAYVEAAGHTAHRRFSLVPNINAGQFGVQPN